MISLAKSCSFSIENLKKYLYTSMAFSFLNSKDLLLKRPKKSSEFISASSNKSWSILLVIWDIVYFNYKLNLLSSFLKLRITVFASTIDPSVKQIFLKKSLWLSWLPNRVLILLTSSISNVFWTNKRIWEGKSKSFSFLLKSVPFIFSSILNCYNWSW